MAKKKSAAKRSAKKPVAKKPAAKKATAKKASAPKPAAQAEVRKVNAYVPKPVEGIGWAPFRYTPLV
jgi:hypothetical protein